ncbi:MAG: M17 family peptidase N-terminal domain-containing protein [Desulfuromonadaceae bacterium]
MGALQVLNRQADRLEGEVVAALFFEDVRPLAGPAGLLDWRLNGRLTELLLRQEVSGRRGEQVLVANNGKLAADWILFFGGGCRRELNAEDYGELLRQLLGVCRAAGFAFISLCLPLVPGMDRKLPERELERVLAEFPDSAVECRLTLDPELVVVS